MPRSKLEKADEQWVVLYAWNTYGVASIKMKLAERSGEPDRLLLFHGGRPLWIEFKRLGREPGPLQAHRIAQLREWGYDVETCDNREDGKTIIDQAARKAGCKPITKALGSQKVSTSRRAFLSKQRLRGHLG